MDSVATRVQQAMAFSVGSLGLFVVFGWLSGNHTAVTLLPGSVAMTFNTALLFLVAGFCLWPARFEKAQLAGAWVLVLLPSMIVGQHIAKVDFGIDWVSLHAVFDDGNLRPGRSAPNTCIGFILAGIACLLFGRAQHQKRWYRVTAMLTAFLFVLGLGALLGYVLKLEAMYRIESFNMMAAPTAAGMLLIAVALWARLAQLPLQPHNARQVTHEQRITRTAALVLTVVALITGLAGFVVLRAGFIQSLSDGVLRTTEHAAEAFEGAIDQHLLMVTTIARRPALQGHIERLSLDRNDADALALAREVANSFLASGVTGMSFHNAQGEHLFSVGTSVKPAASISMPLGSPDQGVELLWHDGFVLWAESPITRHGRVVGKFVAEQRMPRLTAMLDETQESSISTDVLVCGRSNQQAVCFPSRFYPAGLAVPMFKNGQPYLAAPCYVPPFSSPSIPPYSRIN